MEHPYSQQYYYPAPYYYEVAPQVVASKVAPPPPQVAKPPTPPPQTFSSPVPVTQNDENKAPAEELSFKSPTTLNFERMLDAASILAERSVQRKRKTESLGEDNPFRLIEVDKELFNKVVMHMALTTKYKDETRQFGPPIIHEGFFWKHYPVLERILYDNMQDYYFGTRQEGKEQQSFNKGLVKTIRNAAAQHGLVFGNDLPDKKLRDRVRCFYKTHLQNAKKRLQTMQKNPTHFVNIDQVQQAIDAVQAADALSPKLPLKKRRISEDSEE